MVLETPDYSPSTCQSVHLRSEYLYYYSFQPPVSVFQLGAIAENKIEQATAVAWLNCSGQGHRSLRCL